MTDRPIMTDIHENLLQANNALQNGDTALAQQYIEAALGMGEPPAGPKPLAHLDGFNRSFMTACRKNGVSAAYILIDQKHSDTTKKRIITGGSTVVVGMLKELISRAGGV